MADLNHTYLRYECADAFGLAVEGTLASSMAPTSSTTGGSSSSSTTTPVVLVWTTAGSQVLGWNMGTATLYQKLSPPSMDTIGSGQALTDDHVTTLATTTPKNSSSTTSSTTMSTSAGQGYIATGWNSGSLRIFHLEETERTTIHSILPSSSSSNSKDNSIDRYGLTEPLMTLQGHESAVQTVAFAPNGTLLASGGANGTVVLWDLVAETGLFRLIGHTKAITSLAFWNTTTTTTTTTITPNHSHNTNNNRDLQYLISTSLDGLVKVWDLQAQCCTQTIANHNGQVWSGSLLMVPQPSQQQQQQQSEQQQQQRCRFITGSVNGQVRVWNVTPPNRIVRRDQLERVVPMQNDSGTMDEDNNNNTKSDNDKNSHDDDDDDDEVCHYMGSLRPPPNVIHGSDTTNNNDNERIAAIHHHTNGVHVGILHHNSKIIHIYQIRSSEEAHRKKQRRLRRRREKQQQAASTTTNTGSGNKRGILDDDDDEEEARRASQQEQKDGSGGGDSLDQSLASDTIKASDEFEYCGTIRATHKIKDFSFAPTTGTTMLNKKKTSPIVVVKVICALATNALEVHVLTRTPPKDDTTNPPPGTVLTSQTVAVLDMYGHPTGIRSIALSSDDKHACSVSKSVIKIWNVAKRSCLQSIQAPSATKTTSSCYGLCVAFLPGDTHVVVGTREGHLLVIDLNSGDVVFREDKAHDGAIWSLDVRRTLRDGETIAIVTGSADKSVKFWDVEQQHDDENENDDDTELHHQPHPILVHTRTLQVSDDVVAVRYSHSSKKRLVIVSTLDSIIKVFFDDTLTFFLSLYGHTLPALAVDASDDDAILASSGADKTVKIWGLDFGDTHRTMYGHEDSVTDLKFVRRTHNFFTSSKDGTVRYWDGDRFTQILLLHGHTAEVNCLAISRLGAFVLSGGMDRQIRVWERTQDTVFLEEERERELERMFDRVSNQDEATSNILKKKRLDDDNNDDQNNEDQPQSEAAVRKSVMSIASGDRIMEGLERADQELKDAAAFKRSEGGADKKRMPNLLLLGLEPPLYVLWILRSVKSAELEQSLMVLTMRHMERLIYYLIVLLRAGQGVELCSRVAIFMIKTHQKQIIATQTLAIPLRELRRLVRLRLRDSRDVIGFNIAALRTIGKLASDRKASYFVPEGTSENVWAGLGLGSDVAAALESKGKTNKHKTAATKFR